MFAVARLEPSAALTEAAVVRWRRSSGGQVVELEVCDGTTSSRLRLSVEAARALARNLGELADHAIEAALEELSP